MPRYFEDVEVGEVYELDSRYEVTEEEIKEFAEKYDLQPFHLDEEAAEDSVSGSLAASGWHTDSMRMLVDSFLDNPFKESVYVYSHYGDQGFRHLTN